MNSMSFEANDDCFTWAQICGSIECVIEEMTRNDNFCTEVERAGINCPPCYSIMKYGMDDKETILELSQMNIKHNDENSKGLVESNDIISIGSGLIILILAICFIFKFVFKLIETTRFKNKGISNDKQLEYNTFNNV